MSKTFKMPMNNMPKGMGSSMTARKGGKSK
jgi:hypothetical protein